MSDLSLFTADQARWLTGLSDHQLRYWDRTGLFSRVGTPAGRLPYGRIYSFRDLVDLRVLASLRNVHHIPLAELRKIAPALIERPEAPGRRLDIDPIGKHVSFIEGSHPAEPSTQDDHRPSQTLDPLEVEREVRRGAAALQRRSAEQIGRVVVRRYVAGGQPVLAGTRVPTRAIWEFYSAGYSREEIAKEYPDLTPRDIDAAITFENERLQKAS